MTKKQKVEESILETEIELNRLKMLLNRVEGNTLEICPECKTLNSHWDVSNTLVCAFC